MDIQMHLADPKQNELIGIPAKMKQTNPFYQAVELEKQHKYEAAQKIYSELLNTDFNNSALQAALGMNYAVQGKHGEANVLLSAALNGFKDHFETDIGAVGIIMKGDAKQQAVFKNLKKSEIMNALGTTWKHENKIKEARYWFERAQACLPDPNPDIQNNLATLYINEGNPAAADKHLAMALAAQPDHPQARWNKALADLELGRYSEGFDGYHWGKRAEVRMDRNYSNSGTPDWDGTPGQVVVVYGEQGIGDEIMFASCLPDLMARCKQVVFDCHTKLHRLFANSFPDIDIYGTREDMHLSWPMKADGSPRYAIDAKIAIGDLPRFFRREIDQFPGGAYIHPTPESNMKWAKKLNEVFTDGKPVIGLNWIGGHKKTRVEVRSLSLEEMLPVLKQDAHFVSLQYTPHEQEIYEFEQKHGIKIHQWPEACYSPHYDDTAGMVANLDLVITCCSSIVHLAGSMGIPCWVLTPSRPAWRYRLDLDYMPWYGHTVTLFRQKPATVEWKPVVEEVAGSLTDLIEAQKCATHRDTLNSSLNSTPIDPTTEQVVTSMPTVSPI